MGGAVFGRQVGISTKEAYSSRCNFFHTSLFALRAKKNRRHWSNWPNTWPSDSYRLLSSM